MRKTKSAPSAKDAQATDLPNGTFFFLDDNEELHRVVESTPNGIVFTRMSDWYSATEHFRYRHAIQELAILKTPQVYDFVFRSFQQWPNGMGSRSTYEEIPPAELTIKRFIHLWGERFFLDYLGWVRSFVGENDGDHPITPIILADILHFLPFVPADSDRKNLAEHARHKVVRELFQTTLREKKTA